jgi:hypothetical protein
VKGNAEDRRGAARLGLCGERGDEGRRRGQGMDWSGTFRGIDTSSIF